MSTTPPDPNDPTRADLPATPSGPDDPTASVDRTETMPASAGATAVDDRSVADEAEDDRKKAWWLWAILAAVLIGLVLFALLRDDDHDQVGIDDAPTEATEPVDEDGEDGEDGEVPGDADGDDAPDVTEAPADDGVAGDPAGPTAPEVDADDPGTATTEDGTDLFTLLQGDAGDAERLAPHADADVTGTDVQVLEIVDGEGFWLGAGDQRIFAHGAADLTAEVEVGQRIAFDGFLKPNPPADSAEVHDIPEDQGAELHRQQGHHLELRSLTVSG